MCVRSTTIKPSRVLENSGSTLNPSNFPPRRRYCRKSTGTPARFGSRSETSSESSSMSRQNVSERAGGGALRALTSRVQEGIEALVSRKEIINSREMDRY